MVHAVFRSTAGLVFRHNPAPNLPQTPQMSSPKNPFRRAKNCPEFTRWKTALPSPQAQKVRIYWIDNPIVGSRVCVNFSDARRRSFSAKGQLPSQFFLPQVKRADSIITKFCQKIRLGNAG